jgi:hypothetical protein
MLEPTLYRITAVTEDNLFAADVRLDVKLPAMDIRCAELSVRRDDLGLAADLSKAAEKLIGVRIGQGMTKIVRAIVAEEAGSPRIAELVLEAMEMLINALTLPELRKATEQYGVVGAFPADGPKIPLNNVVIGDEHIRIMAGNPRLKDSCIAFKDLDT